MQLKIWKLILFAALLVPPAHAEEDSGGIRGIVHDAQGSPIEGASVLLFPVGHSTHSDRDGSFLLKPPSPGRYTVVVLQQGYSPWAVDGLELKKLELATLKVSLQLATETPLVYYESPTPDDLGSSPFLQKIGEEGLCSPKMLSAASESYRFLWARTFDHPVLVYLRFPAVGEASLSYKEADGAAGYEIGPLIYNEKIPLKFPLKGKLRENFRDAESLTDYLALLREQAAEQFWALPFRIDDPGMIGLDGATWTIEGIKNGKCHVVTRWGPDRKDPFRRFAEALLNLSGRRFYYDEVY